LWEYSHPVVRKDEVVLAKDVRDEDSLKLENGLLKVLK